MVFLYLVFLIGSLFCFGFYHYIFLQDVTSIPPSHTTGIENKVLVVSLNTAAFFRCGGSAGMPNSTLAIDFMFVLLEHWTSIGWYYIVISGQCGGTK